MDDWGFTIEGLPLELFAPGDLFDDDALSMLVENLAQNLLQVTNQTSYINVDISSVLGIYSVYNNKYIY